MKTRRKSSRKGTGTVDGEVDQEVASSQIADESQPPSPFQPVPPSLQSIHISIPQDIPLEPLSTLIPEASLDSPTAETIIHIYKFILAQAADLAGVTSELEEARAQIVRKDVELDQAFQDKESAVSELEKAVETTRNELKLSAQQREELSASQATLQSQISILSSSQSTRSSELDTFQRRIEETEREKRDLVAVVDRLKSDGVQAEEEIRTLRESLKKARAEFSDLQSEVREVRSTETTNKFKIQSLDQQLQLTKQENDRNSAELDAKIEEFAKYRREAHGQRSSLQSTFDSLSHEHESCKAELEGLKHVHKNQQHQLTATLEKVNSLQDQLAEEGAASRAQSDTQARLIELLEKRNADAKKRVQDLDNEWDRTVQEHNEREEILKEQLRREKERGDRLDANLTRFIEGSEGAMPVGASSASPEPNSGASIVASFMKGTKLSDIFDENRRVKEELQKVKVENVRLTDTTTQLISKVQEMAPQLNEQRVEYERQKSETIHLSQQLSVVLSERDANIQYARDTEHKYTTSQKENELLQTQLNDLGRQVQVLLREIAVYQNPGLASIEQENEPPNNTESIDALISNELVVFKHLPSFQEQYTKHLKVIRDLGEKLERVTRDQYEEQSRLENQALEEAATAVATLQDELENQKKSHDIQIRGFMQERDMYKARLASQGQSRSVYSGLNGHVDAPPGDAEYEGLLADLQRSFDIYRNEIGTDMARLREELQDSQRDTAQLQASLAKANAKVEYHNERHAMLTESFARQREEIITFRRRNEDLLSLVHRAEAASHQVSEQLATTQSVAERLRHETATLKAEKELWKGVERRLSEENQSLSKEKSQLSDVMSNINKMHHELEQSVQNDRRRLESQVQLLESQTQDLKTQLNKERELVRHVTLQKELDTKDLHARIDRATQDLSKTRESLVAAETSQVHLHQRADDLSRQLEASLEKLSVYERRPNTTTNSVVPSHEGRSQEELLEAEVAELKGAIKMTEVDLAAARSHVEQFKDISQASEAAFEKINEAYEEYKKNAETQLSKKELDLQSLHERLHVVETELATATQKTNEIQQQLESERKTFATDKKTLEETIIDMTSSAANTQVDEAERASAIKLQEERIVAAEERYQRELISHADSIKAIDNLKQQLSNLQSLIREKQTATDTAQSMLATSEVSWKSQKEALDKEIGDLNIRCRDLQKQNSILHQHLESVNSQASRIRQVAETSGEHGPAVNESGDDTSSDLRSVVAWLRSEKEIVDLQLELNKQENVRLKAQVDHLSRSLEETRATLSEEREHAAGAVASAAQHAELLERINQLNLLRESNATLRSECDAHRKRSESLEKQLHQLAAEVEPVKEEVHTLRAELESRGQQLERLERENQQWKDRSQQILSKYDRIDPAEMHQLKEKLEKLETEKDEWTQAKSSMEAAVAQSDRYKENLANFKKQYSDLVSRSRTTLNTNATEIKALTAERDSLKAQLESKPPPTEQSNTLTTRIEVLVAEKVQLETSFAEEKTRLEGIIENERAKAAAATATVASLSQRTDNSTVSNPPTDENHEALVQAAVDSAKSAWEEERSQLTKARDEAAKRERIALMHSQKLAEDKAHLEASNTKFKQRLSDQLKKQREQQATPTPDVEQLVAARLTELTAEQARGHEAAIQAAVSAATEKLRVELQASTVVERAETSQSDIAAITARHQEELKALETRLTENHAADVKAAVDSAMASARKQEGTAEIAHDVEATVKERLQVVQKEHERKMMEAIKVATESGRKEISTKLMIKDGQLMKAVTAKKDLEEKVRDLEAKLAGLQRTGPGVPASSTPTTPTVPKAVTNNNLPRKPSISNVPAVASTSTAGAHHPHATRGGARGRGRGVAIRGGAAAAAAQAAGRGGVLAQVNSAAAASPSGTSILGAATAATPPVAKRPRDEPEASTESPSLAKRLRGPPVTLQRNRHLPPSSET